SGGKKNRQKERRLMKGFNIAPPPTGSTHTLPPVAEFIASLQQQSAQHDHSQSQDFGSTLTGIFTGGNGGGTPRKLHQLTHSHSHSQAQMPVGPSPLVTLTKGDLEDWHQVVKNHKKISFMFRFHMKRSSSHKRRWGTLIEAAKSGRVSRLISRSRSEDSVCRASTAVVSQSSGNMTVSNGTQESADRFS
ncbi:transient receptor potential-gamma protein-like, partial [Ctenocephalides felis]|uniref:transient receptor potential-gamma protein-like n=1 Tax=Ctenocephalides felis TaxID=7515 RepID=UPI000E6E4B02